MHSAVFFHTVSSFRFRSHPSYESALPFTQQMKHHILHVVAQKSQLTLHGPPDVDGVSSRDLDHTLVAHIVQIHVASGTAGGVDLGP